MSGPSRPVPQWDDRTPTFFERSSSGGKPYLSTCGKTVPNGRCCQTSKGKSPVAWRAEAGAPCEHPPLAAQGLMSSMSLGTLLEDPVEHFRALLVCKDFFQDLGRRQKRQLDSMLSHAVSVLVFLRCEQMIRLSEWAFGCTRQPKVLFLDPQAEREVDPHQTYYNISLYKYSYISKHVLETVPLHYMPLSIWGPVGSLDSSFFSAWKPDIVMFTSAPSAQNLIMHNFRTGRSSPTRLFYDCSKVKCPAFCPPPRRKKRKTHKPTNTSWTESI